MIARIDTAGINVELGEDIKKYITKKIGKLDKYMPKHARQSVHAEVKLRETNNRLGNKYECEVLLHLPSQMLQAKESTLNMFAAVDIVEAKLRNQLVKYKQAHIAHLREKHPGFLGRLRVRMME
ncbi:MAG TPA: ribosome-associated translation inhibitor RaiA [Candidatus Saccharimonadales bacterium]|nr:ribosome-associated translation inhibitor RaiA [Candidatus Saccharimonadales bacterium]